MNPLPAAHGGTPALCSARQQRKGNVRLISTIWQMYSGKGGGGYRSGVGLIGVNIFLWTMEHESMLERY